MPFQLKITFLIKVLQPDRCGSEDGRCLAPVPQRSQQFTVRKGHGQNCLKDFHTLVPLASQHVLHPPSCQSRRGRTLTLSSAFSASHSTFFILFACTGENSCAFNLSNLTKPGQEVSLVLFGRRVSKFLIILVCNELLSLV